MTEFNLGQHFHASFLTNMYLHFCKTMFSESRALIRRNMVHCEWPWQAQSKLKSTCLDLVICCGISWNQDITPRITIHLLSVDQQIVSVLTRKPGLRAQKNRTKEFAYAGLILTIFANVVHICIGQRILCLIQMMVCQDTLVILIEKTRKQEYEARS